MRAMRDGSRVSMSCRLYAALSSVSKLIALLHPAMTAGLDAKAISCDTVSLAMVGWPLNLPAGSKLYGNIASLRIYTKLHTSVSVALARLPSRILLGR